MALSDKLKGESKLLNFAESVYLFLRHQIRLIFYDLHQQSLGTLLFLRFACFQFIVVNIAPEAAYQFSEANVQMTNWSEVVTIWKQEAVLMP